MLVTDGTHQTSTYTDSGRIFLSAQNVKPFRFMPEYHRFVSERAYADVGIGIRDKGVTISRYLGGTSTEGDTVGKSTKKLQTC
jgi:hypothetical protein